ncbi:ferric enterobactin transport ATP-binding protein FepC [Treponema primitia ZAS-2]|uniref:Ferric enterobactin transport ATP-binding protein FepC n=1 Tax=Treponema primitia (strain ATCC BAA-887 / DSM 12427 / ZAS-2) TaxID=545694 RepID=F5YLA3_TREPZ|nr:ABC transporter ATP-binding protein [Treponema primitia]AEF86810.1 ferric enterobactin transport ATP-binding protein FepC [Treponema primitia ZAS-2]
MLEIKNLSSGYDGLDVIHNINLKAEKGEFLCILGPNGCGKSTLLKSVARILPYRGKVVIDGRDLSSFSRKELAKKIALMGQMSEIYFPYSVYDTVSLGRYAHTEGFLKSLSSEDRDIIADILNRLGLYSEKDRMINELSGGQLQRVFLARTLAQNPEIILLDEPTNHLDLKHQIELLQYIITWAKDNNKTVVGVLHDLNMVHYYGDNAAIIHKGTLVSYGKPNQVLDGETLNSIYDMDIRSFMLESLENWRSTGEHKECDMDQQEVKHA